MKRLIVEEVHAFRAEVRAQARAAGQIRRQERFVTQDELFANLSNPTAVFQCPLAMRFSIPR